MKFFVFDVDEVDGLGGGFIVGFFVEVVVEVKVGGFYFLDLEFGGYCGGGGCEIWFFL